MRPLAPVEKWLTLSAVNDERRDGRARVALVLGAGGPVGRAFHAGVVRALEDACQWDARTADLIVGTSAGAQAAALLRAGVDGRELFAHATGETDFFTPTPPA